MQQLIVRCDAEGRTIADVVTELIMRWCAGLIRL
jgi:hypothetical protein